MVLTECTGSKLSIHVAERDGWFTAWEAVEVLFGESERSFSSDVWAFAVVMWEAYACRQPFGNDDGAQIICKACGVLCWDGSRTGVWRRDTRVPHWVSPLRS